MKMAMAERPIERISTSTTESQFTIKATGKAFKILSSGLYKEKVLAIVRELSCNAYDAHIAAGRPDRPFDVHLPNTLEPFFSVRDYGPSLGPTQIGPVYTTYFESTKTESNELIGGLGLGSKSPFCYVDSFTVIARFEGMRRTYTCFFDETDTPSLLLMNEEVSDEESGLEVKLPVNPAQFFEFRVKAEGIYRNFPTAPNVVGNGDYSLDLSDIMLYGKGYRLRDERSRKANALMGVVAYPIDPYAVTGLKPDQLRFLQGTALDIDFGIGVLDITAGREELSYDQRTQNAIIARTQEVMDDITTRIIKAMDECETEFEARILFGRLNRFHAVFNQFPGNAIPYKGRLISSQYFSLETKKDFPTTEFRKFKDATSGRGLSRYDYIGGANSHIQDRYRIEAGENVEIYLDDISSKFMSSRIQAYREQNRHKTIYLINCQDPVEQAKLAEVLEGWEFKKLSDLPRPPAAARAPTRSMRLKANYRSGAIGGHYGREAWEACDTPDTNVSGGVYIKTVSGTLQNEQNQRECEWHSLYRLALSLGLWDKNDVVYAVPKSLVKPFEDSPVWETFHERIRSAFKKKISENDWGSLASLQRSLENFRYEFSKAAGEHTLLASAARGMPDFHDFPIFMKHWTKARTAGAFAEHLQLADLLQVALEDQTSAVNLVGQWRAIEKRYPLIDHVFGGYRYDRDYGVLGSQISEYMLAMDFNKTS